VGRLFQDRFKKTPPFEQPAYDEMVKTAKSLLSAFGVEIELTDSTGQEPGLDLTRGYKAPDYDDDKKRAVWPWIAGIAVLVLGVGVLVFVLATGNKTPASYDADPMSSAAPASS
jgi:hypothetical protein